MRRRRVPTLEHEEDGAWRVVLKNRDDIRERITGVRVGGIETEKKFVVDRHRDEARRVEKNFVARSKPASRKR